MADSSRSWDFTHFSYTDAHIAWYDTLEVGSLVLSKEVCPDTGREHLQGRVRFKRMYRFAAVKKLFPDGVHLEKSVCQSDDNYCRKADSVRLIDKDNRRPGARTDLPALLERVQSGQSLAQCIGTITNYQQFQCCLAMLRYFEPARPYARRLCSYVEAVTVPCSAYQVCELAYWEGYDAHQAIVCNGRRLNLQRRDVRNVLDPSPYRVNVKFGSRQALYDQVFFTCCGAELLDYIQSLSSVVSLL